MEARCPYQQSAWCGPAGCSVPERFWAPKKPRRKSGDAEHLDHDAVGSEGPGAQPHRAHPPRRDPTRIPGHRPEAEAPASTAAEPQSRSARQSPGVLSASAVAPEMHRGQPLQERRPGPDCTSGALQVDAVRAARSVPANVENSAARKR